MIRCMNVRWLKGERERGDGCKHARLEQAVARGPALHFITSRKTDFFFFSSASRGPSSRRVPADPAPARDPRYMAFLRSRIQRRPSPNPSYTLGRVCGIGKSAGWDLAASNGSQSTPGVDKTCPTCPLPKRRLHPPQGTARLQLCRQKLLI